MTNGAIALQGTVLFLGAALRGQHVGLEPVSDLQLTVHFGPYEIATINRRTHEVLAYRKARLP